MEKSEKGEMPITTPLHLCCDFCQKQCSCESINDHVPVNTFDDFIKLHIRKQHTAMINENTQLDNESDDDSEQSEEIELDVSDNED